MYRKLTGMRDGFQLFYHCLRESQNRQSGHKDAADALEERGNQSDIWRYYWRGRENIRSEKGEYHTHKAVPFTVDLCL